MGAAGYPRVNKVTEQDRLTSAPCRGPSAPQRLSPGWELAATGCGAQRGLGAGIGSGAGGHSTPGTRRDQPDTPTDQTRVPGGQWRKHRDTPLLLPRERAGTTPVPCHVTRPPLLCHVGVPDGSRKCVTGSGLSPLSARSELRRGTNRPERRAGP